MTDFPLYDVETICRECGTEYQAKAFLPQGTEPRFGLCELCREVDDAMLAKLKQPPKDHGLKSTPREGDRRSDEVRRITPQRRWEPRD